MAKALVRFCGFAVAAGIFLAAGPALAKDLRGRLTLEEAIQVALKRNPAVAESKERMHAAKEQIGVSRAALLPQVSFSGTYFYGNAFARTARGQAAVAIPGGVSSPISFEKEINSFEVYRFSFNQLIYDFGKTTGQVAGSKAQHKQAAADYAGQGG